MADFTIERSSDRVERTLKSGTNWVDCANADRECSCRSYCERNRSWSRENVSNGRRCENTEKPIHSEVCKRCNVMSARQETGHLITYCLSSRTHFSPDFCFHHFSADFCCSFVSQFPVEVVCLYNAIRRACVTSRPRNIAHWQGTDIVDQERFINTFSCAQWPSRARNWREYSVTPLSCRSGLKLHAPIATVIICRNENWRSCKTLLTVLLHSYSFWIIFKNFDKRPVIYERAANWQPM